MLTATQKNTAQAILNIFETGDVLGDYGNVTVISGDTGHLTFGRSQTTLSTGNLFNLINRYCVNVGARFGEKLKPWLRRLEAKDISLDKDMKLHNILRASADDRVMRETQDTFFDEVYWLPAVRAAERFGLYTPLGTTLVYDGFIHGSWALIRDRTTQHTGDIAVVGEHAWISAYVPIRRNWLAKHKRSDLRGTVYRMDAFQRLIDQAVWGLELPLVVRGEEISQASLSGTPRGCYDGPPLGSRPLMLQAPLARGLDVRLLQLGLSDQGVEIKADGIFGQASAKCIKQYQIAQGLPPTGVADIKLIASIAT